MRSWTIGDSTVLAAIQYRVGDALTLQRSDGILLDVSVAGLAGEDLLIYKDWRRRSDNGLTSNEGQRARQAMRYARQREYNQAGWQARREALASRYDARMDRFRQRSAMNSAMGLAVLRQGLPGNDLLSQQLRRNELLAFGNRFRSPRAFFVPVRRSLE